MKKGTLKFTAFLLTVVGATTGVVAWLSNGFGDWDLNDWSKKFKPNQQVEQQEDTDKPNKPDHKKINNNVVGIDNLGNELLAGKSYEMPKNFAFACSETSQNKTITLHATVLPNEATIKDVNFKLLWSNSESSFAKGKKVEDYIKITKINGSTAKVEYVKPFGEKIIISASTIDGSDIHTECKIDCFKKIQNVKEAYWLDDLSDDDMSFGYLPNASTPDCIDTVWGANDKWILKDKMYTKFDYTAGTIEDQYKLSKVIISTKEDALNKLKSENSFTLKSVTYELEKNVEMTQLQFLQKLIGKDFKNDKALMKALYSQCIKGRSDRFPLFDVKLVFESNYNTYEINDIELDVLSSCFKIPAKSVSLDKDNIKF